MFQTKCQIVEIGKLLLEKGLVTGTWGNVSARVPHTQWVAVTPSGRNYLELSPEDIVIVNLEGEVQAGGRPSSELPLHLAIYRKRLDVGAIVHTHSVFASACAVARKGIPAIIEDLVQMAGGSVDVAEYALPGTVDLAQHVVAALSFKNAALMANHGVVGCGQSLAEAVLVCELIEKAAQILIYANQLGGAHILSNEDTAIMHKFYLEQYRQRQGGYNG